MQINFLAVAKDLDFFEITLDELIAEKNDLISKLEDEKVCLQRLSDCMSNNCIFNFAI